MEKKQIKEYNPLDYLRKGKMSESELWLIQLCLDEAETEKQITHTLCCGADLMCSIGEPFFMCSECSKSDPLTRTIIYG